MTHHKCNTELGNVNHLAKGLSDQEVNLVNCKIEEIARKATEDNFWGGCEVNSPEKKKNRVGDVET